MKIGCFHGVRVICAAVSIAIPAHLVRADETAVASSARVCAVAEASVLLTAADGGLQMFTTGADGCVVIRDLSPGTYAVTVGAPGLVAKDDELVVPAGGVQVEHKVSLEAQQAASDVIVVRATRHSRSPETRHRLDPDTVRKLPGVSGDALKAVQNLPGLARTPFISGALLVRGASPEDSVVLLDGQEIPQLYHFGGITSVIATDMLDTIDFLPGGFGVRYGRAMGGVFDVNSAPGYDDHYSGVADADLYDASAVVQGPVGNAEYGSVVAAARRSYVDAVLPLATNQMDGLSFTVAPRYYDYQLRYEGPANESGARWHAMVYGADDAQTFVLGDDDTASAGLRGRFYLHTLFHRVQGQYTRPLGGDWLLSVWPGVGIQDITIDATGLAYADVTRYDFTLRSEARGSVGPRLNLLVGVEGFVTPVRYHIKVENPDSQAERFSPVGDGPNTTNEEKHDTSQGIGALYAEAEWSPTDSLSMTAGVRADAFAPMRKYSVDPRLSVRVAPRDHWFLKSYVGVYHQPPEPHEWDENTGNPDLEVQFSLHTGLGGGFKLPDGTRIEAEVFYKWMDDLVTWSPQGLSNDGIGRAYGAELMIRREMSERLYGWIAYTISKSERADPYTNGGWHDFDFDQPHIFTAVASYRLGRGWELGARFRYATGNPDTEIVSAFYDADADNYIPVPGAFNATRIPDFHQLDVRLGKTFEFDRWTLETYLDVQNVYNRANPELAIYDHDYEEQYYITGLPVFPSFGLRGEF